MDNKSDYLSFYEALGLKKQATLADLKHAFRLEAKRWHPDLARSVRDSEERQRRIREVNISYDRLSRYYKKHHTLPLFDSDQPYEESAKTSFWHRWSNVVPEKLGSHARSIVSSPLAIPTLLVSLVLSIAALVLMMLPTDSPGRGGALAIPTTDPMPAEQSRYFTFGSTTAQVIRIHGEPGHIAGNAWHYGDSIIYFEAGKVIAWVSGSDQTLSTDPAYPHSFGLPDNADTGPSDDTDD